MAFSIERTIIITLIFIGYTQADSPRISDKEPNVDYRVVDENFTGLLFKIHVQDGDTGDELHVEGEDTFTKLHFNIISDPVNGQKNDIWVHVNVIDGLDRESLGDSVKVKLLITDSQGNPIRYTFTVYIQDINDNSPVFQNEPYNLEIPELPCNKTIVVYNRITATDNDKTANGRVSYSMEAKAQSENTRTEYESTFRIDDRTGRITQTKCLDYKSNSYYQFMVMAKDAGPNGGLNTTADFIIRVKDVQNQPPFFTGIPYRKAINENNQKGSSVLTIKARDGDSGVSNEVNYTITSCSCGDNLFDIGVKSGIITTKTVLDSDSGPIKIQSGNCDLVVLVQEVDHGLEQWGITTATSTVTIIVNDIDDNRPIFEEIKYTAYVKENMPKDSLLILNRIIFVHDEDQGDNARIRITLENTDDSPCTDFVASPSEIQGRGSVSLLVNNPTLLDYEALKNKILHIQVVAAEVNNISSRTKVPLEINVQDTNDNYPKFNTTKFTINIPENTRNNTIITRITAQDADTYPEYKNITYSVTGGSGRFTVDEDTGDIRTHCNDCNMELDREVRSDFYLTLFATDKGGNRNSTEVNVILTDVNDNEPEFSRPTYTVFLVENSTNLDLPCNKRTVYKRIQATDRDINANGRVSYSMQAKTQFSDTKELYEKTFSIDNITGAITLNECFNYEYISYYQFTVTAKDAGPNGGLTATADFVVHVTDVQENTTLFTGMPHNLTTVSIGHTQSHPPYLANNTNGDYSSFPENFTGTIFQIHVKDEDIGDKITADAADDITRTYFDIILVPSTPNDVWISVTVKKDLDRETLGNVVHVRLRITDSQQNELTYVFTLHIYDINDNDPVFQNSPYILEIPEVPCNINSTIFTQILALDKDSGDNGKVTYSMVPKQQTIHSQDLFSIDSTTGHLFLNACLDYENVCYHQFIVTAKDSGPGCRRSATAEFVVLVQDVPE